MRKKKIFSFWPVLLILAVGLIAFKVLGSNKKQSHKRDVTQQVRLVETLSPGFKDTVCKIHGNGVVVPEKELSVLSEVNGQVLFAKNNLKNGTRIEKGELLIEIDSREVENQLYAMRADLLNATAMILPDMKIENSNIYEKWYQYFQQLDIHKETPELPETADSREKMKVSSKNIFTKYYAVKNQEILLSKCFIRAPFNGFIVSNGVIENSFVTRGQHLCNLQDAENLELSVPLLIQDVKMIPLKNNPVVKIYPDKKADQYLTGSIIRKDKQLNPNAQTINVYVTFKNKKLLDSFLPGNYVHVEIAGKTIKDVALIPRHLLSSDSMVYVIKDSVLAQQKVNVLYMQNDLAIIEHTVPDNLLFITTILQKPITGMLVRSSNQ